VTATFEYTATSLFHRGPKTAAILFVLAVNAIAAYAVHALVITCQSSKFMAAGEARMSHGGHGAMNGPLIVCSEAPIHTAQIITYLKLSRFERGYLLNFNVPLLKQGIKRVSI
jgi:hypothetical protein